MRWPTAIFILTFLATSPADAVQKEWQQIMQRTWGVHQGAPQDIQALAQTADGYLWLGGFNGLFRFDGTRFERFHGLSSHQLLSTSVNTLFAPSTGGLWVGYLFGGFSFIRNGQVTNYGGKIASAGSAISFAEGPDGVIWAGTASGVWRFEHSQWNPLGLEWKAPKDRVRLGFDRAGTLWALTGYSSHQMLFLPRGSKQFQLAEEKFNAQSFSFDADRKVITASVEEHVVSDGAEKERVSQSERPITYNHETYGFFDRPDSLWILDTKTVTHIEDAERPKKINALIREAGQKTYDIETPSPNACLVDHEGNIWFADRNGIVLLFYAPFHTLDLPEKKPAAIAVGDDGSLWAGFGPPSISRSIYRLTNQGVGRLPVSGASGWNFIYRADDQTLWAGAGGGLWHFVDGKFSPIKLPEEMVDQSDYLQSITDDPAGGLWISFGRHGLYRLKNGIWDSFGGRSDIPRSGVVIEFTDTLNRVWFGFTSNKLAVLDHDSVRVFDSDSGVSVGNVTAIAGRSAAVWIGGEFGLQRFEAGRFRRILAVDNDWLLGITGILEAENGDLWLNGLSGIFHIAKNEIDEALKDSSYLVKGQHIGSREGLPGNAFRVRPLVTAVRGTDGNLFFAESFAVVEVDPSRVSQTATTPKITIQSISADDKEYPADSALEFPAHASSVAIKYSAISLLDPDAIRTRIKLAETDTDWHEVRGDTPAAYRNLPPGNYHFYVSASDTNGTWSDDSASLTFTIRPAWYQTAWFRTVYVCAAILFLWALYLVRLGQLRKRFEVAIEARVNERTRIARDLHDTLLQSFQGLLLRLQTVSNVLPAKPEEAKRRIDIVLEEGSDAIAEGRDAVHELRSTTLITSDLPEAVNAFAKDLFPKSDKELSPEFRIQVEGRPCDLNTIARDEAYRIAVEGLRNASRHAQAGRVDVEIRYGLENFELRILDNGRGIDEEILRAKYAPGHWGLPGMQERAKLVGGELEVWSKVGSGTEIRLRIPAGKAYAHPTISRWHHLLRKLNRRRDD